MQLLIVIGENEISIAKYVEMLVADDVELIDLLDRAELIDHSRDLKELELYHADLEDLP